MATIEINESGLGQRLELGVGDTLVVRLAENPTTGVRWQLSIERGGPLAPAGDRFDHGTAPHAPGMAGHRVLTFAARHPGASTLSFVQRRLPEPPTGPVHQLTVLVRAG